jgi:hypothetical protein
VSDSLRLTSELRLCEKYAAWVVFFNPNEQASAFFSDVLRFFFCLQFKMMFQRDGWTTVPGLMGLRHRSGRHNRL